MAPFPRSFLFVAGEASGDLLASELVRALQARASEANAPVPAFYGAGGPRLAAAGADLAFDLTQHAVIGLWDVLTNLFKFRRLLRQLTDLALERRPEVIVCVDFNGFNRRLVRAIRERQTRLVAPPGRPAAWNPRVVQFVSPQVWASRPGRAQAMARDFNLLLSIFPFEKAWYAKHAPDLNVEFVGHPMLDRHGPRPARHGPETAPTTAPSPAGLELLLLPGSRVGELRRHLPVLTEAARRLRTALPSPLRCRLVLPSASLEPLARSLTASLEGLQIQIGELPAALRTATVALASTGTVTMECAYFGLPTVTLYKTNWLTYEIGRRIVTVPSLTMPNLLAGETVFPEFIQHDATPDRLAAAALELLQSPVRRQAIQEQLDRIIASLGSPGACERAAAAIARLAQAR